MEGKCLSGRQVARNCQKKQLSNFDLFHAAFPIHCSKDQPAEPTVSRVRVLIYCHFTLMSYLIENTFLPFTAEDDCAERAFVRRYGRDPKSRLRLFPTGPSSWTQGSQISFY